MVSLKGHIFLIEFGFFYKNVMKIHVTNVSFKCCFYLTFITRNMVEMPNYCLKFSLAIEIFFEELRNIDKVYETENSFV